MHSWINCHLKLSYLLFSVSEQLSINLQAKNITVQEAVRGANLLVSHLQSLRTDAKYNAFYEKVIRSLTSEPFKENSLKDLIEQPPTCT